MPNSMVSLNYRQCKPDICNEGSCAALVACPLKLIQQEEKFGFPMINPSHCKGCSKCVTACPQKAISVN